MNGFRLFTIRAADANQPANAADAENRLVKAAQKGDRSAFDALAQTYSPLLRGFVLRRVGAVAVEDVLQETLIAGWTGLPGYSRRARFKAWLFAIALRKCADFHRTRSRSVVEAPLEQAEFVADTRQDWYSAAEWKQTVRDLLTAAARRAAGSDRTLLLCRTHAAGRLPPGWSAISTPSSTNFTGATR